MDLKDWLKERYEYDSRARSSVVENTCFDYIETNTPLQIIDVGSGLGANIRYYTKKIDQNIQWVAIDLDSERLGHMQHYLSKNFDRDPESGKFYVEDYYMTVSSSVSDLLDLHQVTDLNQIDLIVGNAVFDLFSISQFQTFMKRISPYEIPILLTLNYTGMEMSSDSPYTYKFIEEYHTHMQREQEFGRAMGANCGIEIPKILDQFDYQHKLDHSIWYLTGKDRLLQLYLLDFMEEAIPEITENKDLFDQWIEKVRKKVQDRNMQMKIDHVDIFAHPTR